MIGVCLLFRPPVSRPLPLPSTSIGTLPGAPFVSRPEVLAFRVPSQKRQRTLGHARGYAPGNGSPR